MPKRCDFLVSAGPDHQCSQASFYVVSIPFPDKTVKRELCTEHTELFVNHSSWSHHKINYAG